jgi:hypothetical protein
VPELAIYLGAASVNAPGAAARKPPAGDPYRDATLVRREGALEMHFRDGVVLFDVVKRDADTAEALIEELGNHSLDIEAMKAKAGGALDTTPFGYTVMVVTGEGSNAMTDPETLAKVLFAETGDLGKAELGFIETSVLDFGEHVAAVSPAGMLVVGDVDDVEKYLYLAAQTMIGVSAYTSVAQALDALLFKSTRDLTDAELSQYEGRIEAQHDLTQTVINVVRSGLLNADARDSLIIGLLHRHLSISEHEARVRNFLEIAARRVERARALKTDRDQKRLGAIFYAVAVIVGFGDSLTIYVNLNRNLSMDIVAAIGLVVPLLVLTVITTVVFFRSVFRRTIQI